MLCDLYGCHTVDRDVITAIGTLLCTVVCCAVVSAQQTPVPPESKQFDFWVGKWDASGESYAPNGAKTHTDAQNTITREFDGHVVRENFTMGTFKGMSVSVYSPKTKEWHQTWVDNQGGYIPLSGSFNGGKMTLQTPIRAANPKSTNRMVFSNIKPESFDWDWEYSTDGGATWKLNWHLHYTRAKE